MVPQDGLQIYNEERTHQGRWCYGKTLMQRFLDSVPLAKEVRSTQQGLVDGPLLEACKRGARSARLCLNQAKNRLISCDVDRRFTLYCGVRGRARPAPHQERLREPAQ